MIHVPVNSMQSQHSAGNPARTQGKFTGKLLDKSVM